MRPRIFTSSAVFNVTYLATVWVDRNKLTEYERRGFAQFMYITMLGYFESILAMLLKSRLRSLKLTLDSTALPDLTTLINSSVHVQPSVSASESLNRIIESLLDDVESAPFSKLTELFNKIFSQRLSDILGDKCWQDIDALATIRNQLAHGRDLYIDIVSEEYEGTLEGNPMQKPATRLIAAGILEDARINGYNHQEFYSVMFGDEALLYFYESVQTIVKKIRASNCLMYDVISPFIVELPDLKL